ncbi:hypothetical protein K457DRAFT_34575 [Linnemannia elongata AG-77]|uniref:Uncharacterized protein n=1 Tax=Linnemannia elongata AG-77 TaxID=1314771 RepID=A0A197JMU6_9FUNG|nr:hypothetical protein K457DRAFT_34575 [Linnemannia elongata AG-77]
MAPRVDDVAAAELTLWRVSLPDDGDDNLPVLLDKELYKKNSLRRLPSSSKSVALRARGYDSHHLLVNAPDTPVPARASTPFTGYLSNGSRPGTPLSGDLYADEKNMMDKFFAFAPTANFLDAFVDGDGVIPLISGSIHCGKTRAVVELLS